MLDVLPIALITVDAGFEPGTDDLRRIADTAFSAWTGELAARLAAAGLAPGRARDLAATLIALLEGAHVLCRAAGNLDAFDSAARVAAGLAG